MVERLMFKSTKFLEILLILIRFNKNCMGSVFFGSPFIYTAINFKDFFALFFIIFYLYIYISS